MTIARPQLIVINLALLAVLSTACGVRQPGSLERKAASLIKRRITVGGKNIQNPFPATEENIEKGRKYFSYYCTACHGLDGQKFGVPFADRMSPPVPSLKAPEVQSYTDGQLKWLIDNGIYPSGMPASKGILNEDEIWKIVQYIRHLPPPATRG